MQPDTNYLTMQAENIKPYLTCTICNDIFHQPITLSCGHSFCKQCLHEKILQENRSILSQNQRQPILPTCFICKDIIWKPLSIYHFNIVLDNLISKFNLQNKIKRQRKIEIPPLINSYKILIKCKKYKYLPLPYCITDLQVITHYPEILAENSNSEIVIQLPFQNKKYHGILGKIMSICPINQDRGQWYVRFYGLQFIKVLFKKTIEKTIHDLDQDRTQKLSLCVYEPVQSSTSIQPKQFNVFLHFYDMLNNPHYLRQIYMLIDQKVFHQRNNPKAMIYCAMRTLNIPIEFQQTLVETFDDKRRIDLMNDWLLNKSNQPIDEIMRVTIPGKYHSGMVFLLLVMIIAFYMLQ